MNQPCERESDAGSLLAVRKRSADWFWDITGEMKALLEQGREQLRELAVAHDLNQVTIRVLARPLTPEEAIGEPGRRDFPIIIGKERVMEATFLGVKGQAYTDSPREFVGSLEQAVNLELNTNQNRAICVATLNAVLAKLKLANQTVHCKDEEPEECAVEIAERLFEQYGPVKVGLIGLNPAIAERLAGVFGPEHTRITDLSRDNIGKVKFGVEIWDGGEATERLVEASQVIVLTGTTLVNNTFDRILDLVQTQGKDYLVYGITAAGVSRMLGIRRLCPRGRDE